MEYKREISSQMKKRLTYFTIGLYFVLTGIEFAVIFPSVSAYVRDYYHGEDIMLGLTIGAFSLSGLIVSPLMGKWADRTRQTKYLIIFCNVWEIIGSFMYFLGISKWFIVLSRLIAGIGTGAAPAIFADLSRSTDSLERTGVLSSVLACRQFGLLVGPSFNLFFKNVNFTIGSFVGNIYSIPGLFMTGLWLIHQVIVIFLYFDLTALYEMEKQLKDKIYYGSSEYASQATSSVRNYNSINCASGSTIVESFSSSVEATKGKQNLSEENSQNLSNLCPPQSPTIPINYNQHFEVNVVVNNPNIPGRTLSRSMVQSNQIIEKAENFITSSVSSVNIPHQELNDTSNHLIPDSSLLSYSKFYCPTPPLLNGEPVHDSFHDCSLEGSNSSSSEDVSADPKRETIVKVKPVDYAKEYLREEVIVLLFLTFVIFFNELTLETILTPLTKLLYNFQTMENSVMFSVLAGVIILVFFPVKYLSKRFEDKVLILASLCLSMIGYIWSLLCLLYAKPNSWASFPQLLIACLFIITSLPFMVVCVTSLFSKVISNENQALGHGIRRSITNIAMIFGPLWGSSLLNRWIILYGVLIGLMILSLVMLLLSYKYLSSPVANSLVTSGSEAERQPLIQSPRKEVS